MKTKTICKRLTAVFISGSMLAAAAFGSSAVMTELPDPVHFYGGFDPTTVPAEASLGAGYTLGIEFGWECGTYLEGTTPYWEMIPGLLIPEDELSY